MPRSRTVGRPPAQPIRLMIVEPRPLLAAAVRQVVDREPDIEIVALVRRPDEAMLVAGEAAPDVILVNTPAAGSSAAATRRLWRESPDSALVVLGGGDDETSIVGAIELGAAAHVGELARPDELVDAIRQAADGGDPLGDEVRDRPDLLERLLEDVRDGMRSDRLAPCPLSARELEILRLVAAGRRNREIATALDISAQTVKNHLTAILHKLGARNRTRAVTYAVRQGWLRLGDVPEGGEAGSR